MRVPTAEELAAIAAAYLVATRGVVAPPPPATSRWALAGRLPAPDPARARPARRAGSRWASASRLDD
jgi:hypothetical protein